MTLVNVPVSAADALQTPMSGHKIRELKRFTSRLLYMKWTGVVLLSGYLQLLKPSNTKGKRVDCATCCYTATT